MGISQSIPTGVTELCTKPVIAATSPSSANSTWHCFLLMPPRARSSRSMSSFLNRAPYWNTVPSL